MPSYYIMAPGRHAVVQTRVPNLHVYADNDSRLSYYNAIERCWRPVTDTHSHAEIIRALPQDLRANVYCNDAPRPEVLERGVSRWEQRNMSRNRRESLAAGLERIYRDMNALRPGDAGYQLARWLLSNNLTYALGANRLGLDEYDVRYAVKYGRVSSNYAARQLARIGATGFIVDRSLAQ